MRHGKFVHQVAMSFGMDAYNQACIAIDPSSAEDIGPSKRGYMLFIGVDVEGVPPVWHCRYAGTADQVRVAWCNDPSLASDSGADPTRLAHWLDGILSTAIPTTRVGMDAFQNLQAKLQWDAAALEKGRSNPLTLALTSSGALRVEEAQLQLEAEHLQAVELRLGWLLATSTAIPAPRFSLEAQEGLRRLCQKLCRLHSMSMGQAR